MAARTKRRVDVSVSGPFRDQVSRSWLRRVGSHTLDSALPGESCQLSLVITDDDTIKRLNSDYRGLDEITDVLSFSTFHQGHWEGEEEPPFQGDGDVTFIMPPEEPQPLGEVIISYPQAVRQASPSQPDLEKELALLVVHGVLHLLGFDHVEPLEKDTMQAKEQEVLSYIFP